MSDGLSAQWQREGRRPWYWRSTLSFLTNCPDRLEPMAEVFRRHTHSSLGSARMALDHPSWLTEQGEITRDATVGDAIASLKRLHRLGSTGDR
jgi:hypothetical protein